MSATTDTKKTEIEILRPVLGDRFILSIGQLAVCAWFSVFFMYLNYIPLFHSDIWCHVHYGSWMLEHGTLVAEDPFMPLAEGMRVINNAWLSQILFAKAHQLGGPQFMSNLFAIVVFATFAIYTRVFYLLSGRKSLALLGMVLLLGVGWTRHAIIRPEIFGGLFTASLFWLLIRLEPWRSRAAAWSNEDSNTPAIPKHFWIVLPLMFALWANLHGSFAVGLMIVASHAAGAFVVSLWNFGSLRKAVADPYVRRWIWLTELCIATTLLNPYGVDLLIETARFGRNENLRDVLEWLPVRLIDFEGIQFLVAVGITLLVVRFSRKPFHPAEVFLMCALTVLMASTVRMIGWLAPIWAISMMPHITDIWKRIEPTVRRWLQSIRVDEDANADEKEPLWSPPPHTYTLLACLVVWCAFALSPVSQPVLGHKPREMGRVLSKGTPRGVTEYLRENPPEGMVWAPQWWGDWLAWDGPEQLQVFMTTTLHLAPHHVWRDYMRIAHVESGWQRTLDRYAVTTIVMHKELQPVMHNAVRRAGAWSRVYEDDRGVVYRRTHLVRAEREGQPAASETETQDAKPEPSENSVEAQLDE